MRDWGETLKDFSLASHALRARKTVTPRFTDFFNDFEKKPTVLQSTSPAKREIRLFPDVKLCSDGKEMYKKA